eukprot:15568-Rhodomonas_salina.2
MRAAVHPFYATWKAGNRGADLAGEDGSQEGLLPVLAEAPGSACVLSVSGIAERASDASTRRYARTGHRIARA